MRLIVAILILLASLQTEPPQTIFVSPDTAADWRPGEAHSFFISAYATSPTTATVTLDLSPSLVAESASGGCTVLSARLVRCVAALDYGDPFSAAIRVRAQLGPEPFAIAMATMGGAQSRVVVRVAHRALWLPLVRA